MAAIEPPERVRSVRANVNYLAPDSLINRRFVAPGVEHNTGRFESHLVQISDARSCKDRISLDSHGFTLADHKSEVSNFFDKDKTEALYPAEVAAVVKSLTGADRVAAMGWMVRTSGDISNYARATKGYTHRGGVQPPAGDVHVDMMPDRAERMAQAIYEQTFPDGKPYSRFIASSLWRAFSEPPQDWPLAVCDANSVGEDEGTPNTMLIVDALPDEATMLGEIPNEPTAPAAAIFRYSPNHRWWYFSNMNRDEVLLLKFHDSDRSKTRRTPHTAFHDSSFPNAHTRQSIEFRTVAYFL